MNTPLQTKLRLIYFPYLFFSIGLISLYSFLHWLLFIRFHPFLIKEDVVNFIIPFILPWIPLIFWYRRRIKLLKFKDAARDPATGIIMLAGFALLPPLLISQLYLGTASGKLTTLNNIKEIVQEKETRYYQIGAYAMDRNYTRTFLKKSVSGKYNQYLDLSLFLVCPIYDKGLIPLSDIRNYPVPAADRLVFIDGVLSDMSTLSHISPDKVATVTVLKGAAAMSAYGVAGKNGVMVVTTKTFANKMRPDTAGVLPDSVSVEPPGSDAGTLIRPLVPDSSFYPYAWIGMKYTRQISNRHTAEKKQEETRSFLEESWTNYIDLPVTGYSYFDNIPYDNDYMGYQKAVDRTNRFRTGSHLLLLEPKTGPFSDRSGSKFPWIFGSFAIGAVVYLLVLLFIPLDDKKVRLWLAGKPMGEKNNSAAEFFHLLSPRKGFTATPVIVYANVLVFIAMVIAGLGFITFNAPDLLKWGGSYGPYIAEGQCWRLLTSTFLHAGIMHLLFNMYALLFAGLFLEPVIGRNRFFVCYLATGIVASLTSYKIHPDTVSVGASGAIFGMYGVFLALLLAGFFPPTTKKAFLVSILIFIGFNLIAGLSGNVDNAAHVGGLISGIVLGFLIKGTSAS